MITQFIPVQLGVEQFGAAANAAVRIATATGPAVVLLVVPKLIHKYRREELARAGVKPWHYTMVDRFQLMKDPAQILHYRWVVCDEGIVRTWLSKTYRLLKKCPAHVWVRGMVDPRTNPDPNSPWYFRGSFKRRTTAANLLLDNATTAQ